MKWQSAGLYVLSLVFLSAPATAETTYTAMFWNIHSGNSEAATIGRNMAEKGKVDLWGLSEVPSDPAFLAALETSIETATGIDYVTKMSNVGGEDRLAILYNADRLESEPYSGDYTSPLEDLGDNFFEVTDVNSSNTVRPSLGIQLRGDGQSIIVLVNHWKASGDSRSRGIRVDQAEATNTFISRTPGTPIVIAGDHNIPIKDNGTGQQQRAFETLTRKADYLVPNNSRRNVGTFRSGSVLDSVFVANDHPDWESETTIMNRVGNIPARSRRFRDNSRTADHRPLRLVIRSDRDSRIEALEERIALTLELLEMLEEQLADLRGE